MTNFRNDEFLGVEWDCFASLAMTGVFDGGGVMTGIVILGILASVAIPRLAGTKADAEISAAVANLRTLVSDANVYYVAKGTFDTNPAGGAISNTWNQITSVPVNAPTNLLTANTSLKVAGVNCIDFTITKENGNVPAYFTFAKNTKPAEGGSSSVCREVQNSPSLAHYFTSRVIGVTPDNAAKGYIAIGSNTKLVR